MAASVYEKQTVATPPPSFLSLPPEIRDLIYDHCLDPSQIYLARGAGACITIYCTDSAFLDIQLVSRQVREEYLSRASALGVLEVSSGVNLRPEPEASIRCIPATLLSISHIKLRIFAGRRFHGQSQGLNRLATYLVSCRLLLNKMSAHMPNLHRVDIQVFAPQIESDGSCLELIERLHMLFTGMQMVASLKVNAYIRNSTYRVLAMEMSHLRELKPVSEVAATYLEERRAIGWAEMEQWARDPNNGLHLMELGPMTG